MRTIAAIICFLSLTFAAATAFANTPDWSKADARAYLDRRAGTWMKERPCTLSCHTTLPYLMADRVLTPTPTARPAGELLDRIDARVLEGDAGVVWYDANPRRVRQSRATEAVLSAFVRLDSSSRPTAAHSRALKRMLAHQRDDGGFDWLDFGLIPWEVGGSSAHASEAFGAALAAVAISRAEKSGLEVPKASTASLRSFLQARRKRPGHDTDLHTRLMLLWADLTLGGVLSDKEAARVLADVRAKQRADGGWSLGDLGPYGAVHGSDGYATGLIVYLMRRAKAKDRSLKRGRRWLLTHQADDGSWPARSYNRDKAFNHALYTDAATAFAVLALSPIDP